MAYLDFDGVKGYATHANAVKRGKEIENTLKFVDENVRWVVISLPNARFAPAFLYREGFSSYNPGWVAQQTNVCVMN